MMTFTNKNDLMHFLETSDQDVRLKGREVFSDGEKIAHLIVDPEEKLFKVIEKSLNIKKDDITGGCRKRHLVDARTIFAHKMRNEYSVNELARKMKKDHSTVVYYLTRYEAMMKYADFRELVKKVEKNL